MKKITQRITCCAVALLAVLLTGCATAPLSLRPDTAQNIHKLAVISIMGDDFEVVDFGVLVFQNKSAIRKVPEWGIDSNIEKAARHELESTTKYTVVDIGNERSKVVALPVTTDNFTHGRQLRLPNDSPVLRELKDKYGIDALIVVSRGKLHRHPLSAREVYCSGNGIRKEAEFANMGKGRIVLHSSVAAAIYDTGTSKLIASAEEFRWIHVDTELFNQCMAEKELSNIAGLNATVTNMINATVCDGLRHLKLTYSADQHNTVAKGKELVNVRGVPPDGKFAKIKKGMTMREVYDLIGMPTDSELNIVNLNPFYTGQDAIQVDALYRNDGRITFGDVGIKGYFFKVQDIKYDPNECGIASHRVGFK